ncbi:MAG: homoserine O-acetyltransferase [Candidatus Altiarchaeota archaeon]|nr:homoserine O-acetyltransferase [Candidatus Altiarchaeota archaeon]
MTRKDGSVGVVKTKHFKFDELALDSGQKLAPVRIAYETYGRLNRGKSNAILVCHALSGDAHAAGKHGKNSRKNGWYDIAIGPGKTFDTRKYFVICSNVIGGCKGSTGPPSINPKTKKPYGLSFPAITVKDIIRAQKKLIDYLGISRLFCVTGGSLGGMQALAWAVDYPDSVKTAVVIAAAARQYPMGIALHEVGRQAIINDPEWNDGNYYKAGQPKAGLALARKIGHITYLSHETFERKFGRQRSKSKTNGRFQPEFEVSAYLNHKGAGFVRRFDANSYLYLTKAIDDFDLTENGKKGLKDVFKSVKAKILLVSFTSDWLYPPEQVEELYNALAEAGVPSAYRKLDLPYGHDAFLVYNNTLGNILAGFIVEEAKEHSGSGQAAGGVAQAA